MAKATPVPGLTPRAPLRLVGPRILTARLRDVEQHEAGLPAEDPVHDMRVAARRLRAALRLLRLRELDPPVKELQDALGEVRDLQLQVAWLRERDKELAQRREALSRKSQRALEGALAKWRSQTLPRLLDAAGRTRFGGKLSGGRVRKLLRKRLLRFEQRLEAALKKPAPLPMHRVRISVKQLRYLFELVARALPKASGLLLTELPPLQEALGELHDVDVRIHLLRSYRRAALLREQEDAREKLAKIVGAELVRWKVQRIAPRTRKVLE